MAHSIQNYHTKIFFVQNMFFVFFDAKFWTRIFLFRPNTCINNFGVMNFQNINVRKKYV